MALGTYAQLQTAVGDWLNRSDLTSAIPDFITLVEGRLRRQMRAAGAVTRNGAFTIDSASETLPTDCKEVRSIAINNGQGSDYNVALKPLAPEQLAEMQAYYANTGTPQYYCVVGSSVYFMPQPDQTYTGLIVYELEIPPLATNSTNWLLTDYPDVYLYGALVEASPYLRDDARVPAFEQRFKEALGELELHRDRAEYGANTPVQRFKTLG